MSNKRGAQYGKRDSEGSEINVWGGIASATVEDWAEALDTTPQRVAEAVEEIDPMVDTAIPKGRSTEDRPTDPALRSVALSTEKVSTLRDTLRNGEGGSQS